MVTHVTFWHQSPRQHIILELMCMRFPPPPFSFSSCWLIFLVWVCFSLYCFLVFTPEISHPTSLASRLVFSLPLSSLTPASLFSLSSSHISLHLLPLHSMWCRKQLPRSDILNSLFFFILLFMLIFPLSSSYCLSSWVKSEINSLQSCLKPCLL